MSRSSTVTICIVPLFLLALSCHSRIKLLTSQRLMSDVITNRFLLSIFSHLLLISQLTMVSSDIRNGKMSICTNHSFLQTRIWDQSLNLICGQIVVYAVCWFGNHDWIELATKPKPHGLLFTVESKVTVKRKKKEKPCMRRGGRRYGGRKPKSAFNLVNVLPDYGLEWHRNRRRESMTETGFFARQPP